MKKIISTAAVLLMTAVLITGCGNANAKNPSGSEGSGQLSSSEEQQLSAESGSDGTADNEDPTSNEDDENIDAEAAEGITVKTSDYGYAMKYDADRYEYRRVEGYDDYSLKKYEGDKPSVFLCVSAIEAEYFDEVRETLMGEDASSVVLGKDGFSAEMTEQKDTWDEGEIYSRSYLCRRPSGSGLLIEMQYYTENGKNSYERDLKEMLSSIELR